MLQELVEQYKNLINQCDNIGLVLHQESLKRALVLEEEFLKYLKNQSTKYTIEKENARCKIITKDFGLTFYTDGRGWNRGYIAPYYIIYSFCYREGEDYYYEPWQTLDPTDSNENNIKRILENISRHKEELSLSVE